MVGVVDAGATMTRSAIELDAYGSMEAVGEFAPSNSFALASTVVDPFAARDSVWIPSPHVITTNNHHSRYSYCACCHGKSSRYYFREEKRTTDDRPFDSYSEGPPPLAYATQSMPRLRPKWKSPRTSYGNHFNGGKSAESNDNGYGSQTLPTNSKRLSKRKERQNGESLM